MLGAYLVLFPQSRVLTLVFVVFVEVPAVLLLGLWFATQLLSGLGTLAVVRPEDMGGVAFWAHAGGFAAGAALVLLFRRPERMRVEWWDQARRQVGRRLARLGAGRDRAPERRSCLLLSPTAFFSRPTYSCSRERHILARLGHGGSLCADRVCECVRAQR